VFFFGAFEARPDQLNLLFRRLDSGLSFLLEDMQDIYATCQTDRVYGPIRVACVALHDLQDAGTAKAPQRLGIGVLSATLRYIERVANRVLDIIWIRTRGLPWRFRSKRPA
jgi:hypothetical protein